MGIEDKLKDFAKRNIWGIGFGVYHGATGAPPTENLPQLALGAGAFGVAWPLAWNYFHKQGKTGKQLAREGVEAGASYVVAYTLTHLLLYQNF